MKNIYRGIETTFEKLTSFATIILGNSISFILAFCMIAFWMISRAFYNDEVHYVIRDIVRDFIHGATFLSLFIIQKEFNRFSASLHLKVNELVVSNESASNAVINVAEKTEYEMTELAKEYTELAVIAVHEKEEKEKEEEESKENV